MLGRNEKRVAGPIGGGAWTQLFNRTINDEETVDFVLENASYSSYQILCENIAPATDDEDFYMRFSTDGGSSYITSNYRWTCFGYLLGLAFTTSAGTAVAQIEFKNRSGPGEHLGNATNETGHFNIFLYNTGAAKFTQTSGTYGYRTAGGSHEHGIMFGENTTAQNTDAVQFLMSDGNILSGEIKVLGLKI